MGINCIALQKYRNCLFQNHKIYFEQTIGLLAYQVEQIKTVNITATVLNW